MGGKSQRLPRSCRGLVAAWMQGRSKPTWRLRGALHAASAQGRKRSGLPTFAAPGGIAACTQHARSMHSTHLDELDLHDVVGGAHNDLPARHPAEQVCGGGGGEGGGQGRRWHTSVRLAFGGWRRCPSMCVHRNTAWDLCLLNPRHSLSNFQSRMPAAGGWGQAGEGGQARGEGRWQEACVEADMQAGRAGSGQAGGQRAGGRAGRRAGREGRQCLGQRDPTLQEIGAPAAADALTQQLVCSFVGVGEGLGVDGGAGNGSERGGCTVRGASAATLRPSALVAPASARPPRTRLPPPSTSGAGWGTRSGGAWPWRRLAGRGGSPAAHHLYVGGWIGGRRGGGGAGKRRGAVAARRALPALSC